MVLYVNNVTGSNTSPYDTMAKGATLMATVDSLAVAGEEIRVAHDHNEATAGSVALDWSNGTSANPVKILSVNRTTEALQAGAKIGTTVGNFNYLLGLDGSVYCYGVTWTVSSDLDIAGISSGARQRWENCTFTLNFDRTTNNDFHIGRGSNVPILMVDFISCTWDQSAKATWKAVDLFRPVCIRISDLTIVKASTTNTTLFKPNGDGSTAVDITDSDISDFTNLSTAGFDGSIIARRCKLKSGYSIYTGTKIIGDSGQVQNSGVGTISGGTPPPLGLTESEIFFGKIKTVTAQFRTGGASDGDNSYSWEMNPNTNVSEVYTALESPPIVRWVSSGSATVTLYVASGVTLNDDDFWVEVSSPNETASPNTTAEGRYQSTRMDPLGTPAALTTDSSSTWNGSGVGTKQKIDISIAPAIPGPVVVRCFLALDTNVYVDPYLDVA